MKNRFQQIDIKKHFDEWYECQWYEKIEKNDFFIEIVKIMSLNYWIRNQYIWFKSKKCLNQNNFNSNSKIVEKIIKFFIFLFVFSNETSKSNSTINDRFVFSSSSTTLSIFKKLKKNSTWTNKKFKSIFNQIVKIRQKYSTKIQQVIYKTKKKKFKKKKI